MFDCNRWQRIPGDDFQLAVIRSTQEYLRCVAEWTKNRSGFGRQDYRLRDVDVRTTISLCTPYLVQDTRRSTPQRSLHLRAV